MPTVYFETSVIGYLASRRSSDLVIAASQLLTLEWWNDHRVRFELFASQATVDECAAGDVIAARERLVFLQALPILPVDSETLSLAQALMIHVGLPAKAGVDATLNGSSPTCRHDKARTAGKSLIADASPNNSTYPSRRSSLCLKVPLLRRLGDRRRDPSLQTASTMAWT